MERLQSFYRMQQIHHAIFLNLIEWILPLMLPVAISLMVLTIFSVIRIHDRIPAFVTGVLIMILLFALIITQLTIEGAARVTDYSEKSNTVRKWSPSGSEKLEQRVIRSNRALKFAVCQCCIQACAFPIILDSFVITNTINLLVAIH
jgi:hypothetical protein